MRVKNNKQTSDSWCGQTLDPAEQYDLQASEVSTWQSTTKVVSDLTSGDLLVGDGTTYKMPGAQAVAYLLGVDSTPKDTTGRPITRMAATVEGWHYQLLSCNITTSKLNGAFCREKDLSDPGMASIKLYDSGGAEITVDANEGQATKTVVTINPLHSYEIMGAIFGQHAQPATDVYLWATGLPGIANVKFARGGINLKHCGVGVYQLADGRASKYLGYNAGMPGLTAFEFTMQHGQGVVHEFMLALEIYKAP